MKCGMWCFGELVVPSWKVSERMPVKASVHHTLCPHRLRTALDSSAWQTPTCPSRLSSVPWKPPLIPRLSLPRRVIPQHCAPTSILTLITGHSELCNVTPINSGSTEVSSSKSVNESFISESPETSPVTMEKKYLSIVG